jgi:hypothetical protein
VGARGGMIGGETAGASRRGVGRGTRFGEFSVCAWEEVDGVYPSVSMVPSMCGARGEVLGDQGVRGVTGPESSDEEPRGSSGRSAVLGGVAECSLGVMEGCGVKGTAASRN